jgi:capsular exopolysaccharide synthesis family protein
MLRTAITYFNLDKGLQSIVITSAGEKEGKTTIATRLALNIARAGQRVVLVDADLRRAQVGPKFGLTASDGLGPVLAGKQHVSDALVPFPLEDAAGGRLSILPAGDTQDNPAALMSSDAMVHVLKGLEARSDLVIIDTPAALAVSDSLPLMGLASGVVLVARMNKSSRETIRRLQRMITAAHGTLLGVVATGAAAGAGYDHYSPTLYAKNGSRGRRLGRRRAKTDTPPAAVAADTSADGTPDDGAA